MSFAAGARLGSYEVVSPLGSGGMGEVYRAHDSKLKRDVAIKVLPAALVQDRERLARFEREAQLLAQLNHPNIAQIYALEKWGQAPIPASASTTGSSERESEPVPTSFLVMELVEGPTLADRLAQGALPLDEAFSLARQIAEALEEAHEKGIVHRDLKPQNVKASIEGKAKVLDFGLAKAMDASAGSVSGGGGGGGGDLLRSPTLMNSPTLTAAHGTQLGVILGTAAYMAPEQARGAAVDKRADIWAFGVVLWELLTGKRLFEGETVSDTLAAVLRAEVDWELLPPATPAPIRTLLRRCLERNPKNRLHDVADARIVLDDALAGRSDERTSAAPAAVPAPAAPPRRLLLAAAAVALAVGGLAGWLARSPGPLAAPPDSRWTLALPDGSTLSTADSPQIALSRDGRLLAAAVTGANGVTQLLVRRSDEFEPNRLQGTEGATSPFFSPDGTWLGFFRGDALMKIPVGGGPPIRIAGLVNSERGATWSPDGWIYFTPGYGEPLSRVRPTGGEVESVTRLDTTRSERTHRWPDALPDGSAILFTCDTVASAEYYDDARIEAVRPTTGERRVLVEGASQARYAPGGHLVFARGGSLFAVRFDPRKLEVRGAPVEVARGVSTNVGSGAVQFAIDGNGAALWVPGGLSAAYGVVAVDARGAESPVEIPPAPYNELALSPEGSRLALVGGPGGISDLWVADLARGSVSRLTSGEFVRMPTWSPDGTRLAYAVVAQGIAEERTRIDWRPADGSRGAETLIEEGFGRYPSAFAPDGRTLIYDAAADARISSANVWALPLDGDRRPRALTEGPFVQAMGAVSPDGRWLAYMSTESGQNNVYVRPFPAGDGRWQISTPLGVEPRWAPDGRAIYYRADSVLYRVAVDAGRGFSASRPERVLDRVASGVEVQSFSLAPDGSRIFTLRTAEGSGARRILHLDLDFARRLDSPAAGAR